MSDYRCYRVINGTYFPLSICWKGKVTESDILGPSEAFRHGMDYFSHTKSARQMLERLASLNPTTLACMHRSARRGHGTKLLLALADALFV